MKHVTPSKALQSPGMTDRARRKEIQEDRHSKEKKEKKQNHNQ